ncbi:hypothetical protein [Flavobacterium oreochromis]|uniref:hypothetical protein n=1 Tax=Flavobacterium oreochromis TaxID=2906078 RepID=UPI0021644FA8|nr:hypothetical protein [Flavobacterium oreochromis]
MLKTIKSLFFFLTVSAAVAQQKMPDLILKDLENKDVSIKKILLKKTSCTFFPFGQLGVDLVLKNLKKWLKSKMNGNKI